ncbi:alpha-galactosidase [Streptomyces sp. 7-21]|uniref:alpha-galactosidase n=1 Tax=Streptomyces sp. 7-21 TaxID=2802283 RepID=UPI0035A85796
MPEQAEHSGTGTGGGGVPAVEWGHAALTAAFATAPDGSVRTVRLGPPGAPDLPLAAALPVVEVLLLGHGSDWSGRRAIETAAGARLRLRSHEASREGVWHRLRLRLRDEESGLAAEVLLDSPDGVPAVRSRVRLVNEGEAPLVLLAVSSLTLGGLPSPAALDVRWADNDWLAECRWRREPLRARLPDLHRAVHDHDGRGAVVLAGQGSWPTAGHLPMGALTDRRTGTAWLWEVESASGWRWEAGERERSTYLALHGPVDTEHHWSQPLGPGESFTTVPAALAVCADGFEGALAALTACRRARRRPHPDHARLPVIFNDYMNTLRGDPTTGKLLPLIDAAAEAGAEYFVIDAGWYDDDARGWWDSVGAWEPAASRFPGPRGIHEVLDRIRERGMVPGLWLEPEVVGVRSPLARSLPDEAFFRRGGVRVREHGRYQLDLRHPAARAHLDATVDRLAGEWGVGYLKLDYNISVPPGTDAGAAGPGAGLLGHVRAYHAWLADVLDRYPDLVLENCASGGMRMDGASLSLLPLQSTSDQQDFLRYPPIAAAAPTAVPPEQGAVWAYPQPEFSDDEIAFALAGALLGRVHLSGHLDRMSPAQRRCVAQAVAVYKDIRADLPGAVPFWPLGLPGWEDPWLALGLRAGERRYLTVWHRAGGDTERVLPLPALRDVPLAVEVLHPAAPAGTATWAPDAAQLTVSLPRTPTALLLRLTPMG